MAHNALENQFLGFFLPNNQNSFGLKMLPSSPRSFRIPIRHVRCCRQGKSRNGRERALRYVTSFGPMNLLYNLLERMTSHGGVRVLSHFEISLGQPNILENRRRVMKKNVAILADSPPLSTSRHNTMFLKNWQHLLQVHFSCVSEPKQKQATSQQNQKGGRI